jgi:hypothetical protein
MKAQSIKLVSLIPNATRRIIKEKHKGSKPFLSLQNFEKMIVKKVAEIKRKSISVIPLNVIKGVKCFY